MTNRAIRTTVYFKRELYEVLRLKAMQTSQSISALVNDAVRVALGECDEDISACEEKEKERLISYEELIKRLKTNSRI